MPATEDWPDQLPLPTIQGYGIAPGDPIARTEMEAGEARQRRRFTNVPSKITCSWRFNEWQFALFESWYNSKAQQGASYFNISLAGGQGIVPHEARFTSQGGNAYRASMERGNRYKVMATLEVRSRPVLSEETYDLLIAEDPQRMLAAFDRMHQTIHTSLPGAGGWN